MARRQAPLQVNEFTGGLNTEFNPLAMPPNISIDELNMEMSSDGSRSKRLGFNLEPDAVETDTSVAYTPTDSLSTSMFRWDHAGGDPSKSLMVVQIGSYFAIHDMDVDVVSGEIIYSENFGSGNYESTFSYASVDGVLIVVNSEKPVLIYEYDGTSITKSTDTLYIRDLFGVSLPTLTDSNNLTTRPTTLDDRHLYNLRNQTFSSPRPHNYEDAPQDPVASFYEDADGYGVARYPSNADDLNRYLFAEPNADGNKTIERFFSRDMVRSAPSVGEAPKGHFIIDALERGTSRLTQEESLRDSYPELTLAVGSSSLPTDKTPGGASVISSFAGRTWFGGFSGQLIGGDPKSPRMSSYVLFSSLVRDKSDITRCYQRADPTSNEDSALVDTDGGFIRLDGAYGINQMINVEGSLFVFAANGVWRISGGESSAFSATNYIADKLSNEGCVAPNSVVLVSNQIFFWGEKGIFNISRNEFGFWVVEDITKGKIESFYLDIPTTYRKTASSSYDIFTRKIRWVYTLFTEENTETSELILDLNYRAFTKNKIENQALGVPCVCNLAPRQPIRRSSVSANVTVSGSDITVNSEVVTLNEQELIAALRQSLYLVITRFSPVIKYSFGYYRDTNFYDWGIDNYEAYLISGALTGGEARYKKQAPYLNVFLKRTEDGFDSNFDATSRSSCMVSAQWNWTSNSNSSKWSTPRQAYRYNSVYFPENILDSFDTGNTVIVTRNKIRGIGHAVSFKFNSEEGKNMHIHGWSFDLQTNGKE